MAVVTPVYATTAEYDTYVGAGQPAVAGALLARASGIIDELLIGARYAIDTATQMPTDPLVIAALVEATCAQAQWMDATGDTTGVGDVVEVDSASIGSVSFSGQSRATSASRTTSGAQVAAGAIRALRVAGVLPVGVIVHG